MNQSRTALYLPQIVDKLSLVRYPRAFADRALLLSARLKLSMLPTVASWPAELTAIADRAFPVTAKQPCIRVDRVANDGVTAWGVAFDVVRDEADDLACEALREDGITVAFHLRGAGIAFSFAGGTPGHPAWESVRSDVAILEREARDAGAPATSYQLWDGGSRLAVAFIEADVPRVRVRA